MNKSGFVVAIVNQELEYIMLQQSTEVLSV